MGAHVWQRDPAGGKTFAVGVREAGQQQLQRTGKRKLVWSREGAAAAASTTDGVEGAVFNGSKRQALREAEHTATPSNGHVQHHSSQTNGSYHSIEPLPPQNSLSEPEAAEPPSGEPTEAEHAKRQAEEAAASAARARAKLQQTQAELAALRRKINDKNRTITTEQVAAEQTEEQQKASTRHQKREREQRRARLEAGFAEAFRHAKEMATAEAEARRSVAFADEAEVGRVLRAGSDYEVLRLRVGTDSGSIRRRYKEMAVALHPDKCRVEGATDAFQRLVKAYQNLLKYVS